MMLTLAAGARHFELSVARRPMFAGQGERFIALSRGVAARKSDAVEMRQRKQEPERFKRVAAAREMRMSALKHEVNELARADVRPARYDVWFDDALNARATP